MLSLKVDAAVKSLRTFESASNAYDKAVQAKEEHPFIPSSENPSEPKGDPYAYKEYDANMAMRDEAHRPRRLISDLDSKGFTEDQVIEALAESYCQKGSEVTEPDKTRASQVVTRLNTVAKTWEFLD